MKIRFSFLSGLILFTACFNQVGAVDTNTSQLTSVEAGNIRLVKTAVGWKDQQGKLLKVWKKEPTRLVLRSGNLAYTIDLGKHSVAKVVMNQNWKKSWPITRMSTSTSPSPPPPVGPRTIVIDKTTPPPDPKLITGENVTQIKIKPTQQGFGIFTKLSNGQWEWSFSNNKPMDMKERSANELVIGLDKTVFLFNLRTRKAFIIPGAGQKMREFGVISELSKDPRLIKNPVASKPVAKVPAGANPQTIRAVTVMRAEVSGATQVFQEVQPGSWRVGDKTLKASPTGNQLILSGQTERLFYYVNFPQGDVFIMDAQGYRRYGVVVDAKLK